MKILVIDDTPRNQESAHSTLVGHDVTVIGTVKEAYEALRKGGFDAVLTDLFMPIGDFRGAVNRQRVGTPQGELPVGLVFALKASNMGIRTVICTDADHHADWICSLLDLVGDQRPSQYDDEPVTQANPMVAYVEARSCPTSYNDGPITKDWGKAMERSGLFPELEP